MTGAIAAQQVEVGAIVRIVAPGSRESDGEERVIPAMVTHQWPDGSLQLYCFHFQGSPLLANAVRPEAVELVLGRAQLELLEKRLAELEHRVSLETGWKPGSNDPRFEMANDAR